MYCNLNGQALAKAIKYQYKAKRIPRLAFFVTNAASAADTAILRSTFLSRFLVYQYNKPMSGISRALFLQFNVQLEGDWPEEKLDLLYEASEQLFIKLLPSIENINWMNNLVIRSEEMPQLGLTSKGLIRFNVKYLSSWTIVHEFAHAWDFAKYLNLSWRMRRFTHSWGPIPILRELFPENAAFWYHVRALPPPCGTDKNFSRLEDFAEAVTAYVYPDEAKKRAAERGMAYELYGYESFMATPRGQFIYQLINDV